MIEVGVGIEEVFDVGEFEAELFDIGLDVRDGFLKRPVEQDVSLVGGEEVGAEALRADVVDVVDDVEGLGGDVPLGSHVGDPLGHRIVGRGRFGGFRGGSGRLLGGFRRAGRHGRCEQGGGDDRGCAHGDFPCLMWRLAVRRRGCEGKTRTARGVRRTAACAD